MNAIPEQEKFAAHAPDWPAHFRAVNEWRGACLHQFTLVEMAVTQALLSLADVKPDGAKIKLRHLGGQRMEDLASVIGPAGPFKGEGKVAHKRLAEFRANHEAFRHLLCHGHIKVTAEYGGNWLLVIRETTIRARIANETVSVIEQAGALELLKKLKRDGQELCTALGQLRKVSPPSA
jgi:hypothetical protein